MAGLATIELETSVPRCPVSDGEERGGIISRPRLVGKAGRVRKLVGVEVPGVVQVWCWWCGHTGVIRGVDTPIPGRKLIITIQSAHWADIPTHFTRQ